MIDVIYRLCEDETTNNLKSCRPSWFNKINCLNSFIKSIEFSKESIDRLFFVHDGPEGILFDYINKLNINFEFVKINYQDKLKSLLTAVDIADYLTRFSDSSIYFIEDDYLHKQEAIKKLSIAINKFGLITGYDHLYRYIPVNPPDVDYPLKIVFDKETNMHWRTSESTTHSWLTRADIYKKISKEIKYFELWDTGLYIELHEKGIPLWSPIPGLTTHVDDLASPGIDWEKINKNYEIQNI